MDKQTRDAIERADKARNFPTATCPASRHTQTIGEHLARQQPYAMLTEEPDHCGVSILSTVASLWEARAEINRLRLLAKRLANAVVTGQRYEGLICQAEDFLASEQSGNDVRGTP